MQKTNEDRTTSRKDLEIAGSQGIAAFTFTFLLYLYVKIAAFTFTMGSAVRAIPAKISFINVKKVGISKHLLPFSEQKIHTYDEIETILPESGIK